jgi:hypothetical protein
MKKLLITPSLIFLGLHCASAQFAQLTLQSQKGDFIGQGGTYDITYTPQNSQSFSVQVRRTIGSPALPAELLFVMGTTTSGSDNTFALLSFGTDQLGIPIQPGFYPDAERADFASPGHPGLDVSFQNRGSNTLTGAFTISEVTFGANNAIETFSASFEQHSEGASPALFGTFIYSAVGVPEPSVFALMICVAGTFVAMSTWRHIKRRHRVFNR